MRSPRPEYMKEYSKIYRELNKEKLKKKAQEVYSNLSGEVKYKNKTKNKKWISDHPTYKLWKAAKDSSKQRELEFSITIDDIIIPIKCPYLNISLTNIADGGRQDTNISLDRIDNSKGYIPGNIQVISSKANYMKRNASIKELIEFAKGILNTHL